MLLSRALFGNARDTSLWYNADMRLTEHSPHLIDQWADEQPIENYTHDSHYVAKWHCNNGYNHVYTLSIKNRTTRNLKCNICRGMVVLKGFNDLASQYPDLVKEYSSKNQIPADEILAGSHQKSWWICRIDNRHEWPATGDHRIRGRGCPICSGHKVLADCNDLTTTHPHLADEWSVKNIKSISEVSQGSHYRATWQCSKGHEWDCKVADRTQHKTDCPRCCKAGRSKQEIELYNWVCEAMGFEPVND